MKIKNKHTYITRKFPCILQQSDLFIINLIQSIDCVKKNNSIKSFYQKLVKQLKKIA